MSIELLAFSAKKINDYVQLSWSTALEINTDYFVIEKSIDGLSFEALEQISAAGISNSIIKYSGYDKNIVSGKNYYRLKQVDLDGTSQYSKIVFVEVDRIDYVSISPNPFKNKLIIEGYFSSNNELNIINLKGESVFQQNIDKGEKSIKINIPNLKNGVYFVKINNNNGQKLYKVIKT